MESVNIKTLPIEKIELNTGQIEGVPENPRTYSNEQMEAMVKSIKDLPEMLKARPLIVYPEEKTGKYIVIGGNRRFDAAKHLKYKELPCYVLDVETPPETIRAYLIKDNLAFGDWDISKLIDDWEAPELEDFGFDVSLLGDYAADTEIPPEEIDDDDFEEDVESICKPGDVWILGEHRLLCGDATVQTDYEKLMLNPDSQTPEVADLLLTDPPYNVNYTGGTKDKLTIQNDNMKEGDFIQFLTDAFLSATTALKPGGAYYIWHASLASYEFFTACRKAELAVKQVLIWVKSSFPLGRQDYQWNHEPCIYGFKDGAAHYFIDIRNEVSTICDELKDVSTLSKSELVRICDELLKIVPTSIIREKKPAKSELHPTMKPVPLFARLIRNSSRQGEIVLDPFGGSGTTLVACEQMGRKARLLELDPHYCDVIIKRWEGISGQQATLWQK